MVGWGRSEAAPRFLAAGQLGVVRLGQDSKAVCDELDGVSLAFGGVVGILTDPAGDVNHIALLGLGGALDQPAEESDLVPVGVGDPLAIVLAVVVCGDRKFGDLVQLGNLSDAADDAKFSDVLHWLNLHSIRLIPDGCDEAAGLTGSREKTEGPRRGNRNPTGGYSLDLIGSTAAHSHETGIFWSSNRGYPGLTR